MKKIGMFIAVGSAILMVSGCTSPLFIVYREPAETIVIRQPAPARVIVYPQEYYCH